MSKFQTDSEINAGIPADGCFPIEDVILTDEQEAQLAKFNEELDRISESSK